MSRVKRTSESSGVSVRTSTPVRRSSRQASPARSMAARPRTESADARRVAAVATGTALAVDDSSTSLAHRRGGEAASVSTTPADTVDSPKHASHGQHPTLHRGVILSASGILLLTLYGLYVLFAGEGVDAAHATAGPPTLFSPAVARVWWAGWLTAASTSLGTLPFAFPHASGGVAPATLAAANAIAGGMMSAASLSLVYEGVSHDSHALTPAPVDDDVALSLATLHPITRVVIGVLIGLAFIFVSKRWLDAHEDVKFIGFDGMNARRIVLLLTVMTLHSLAEGIGLGVAFGSHKRAFGDFISTTLAIHNVPEGLAVSLVTIPKGMPILHASVWAFLTSLPQPIMAVPAYLFVRAFGPVLPIGLGFAAGAMLYVAIVELLAEARAEIGTVRVSVIAVAAAGAMWGLQYVCAGEE